MQQGLSSPASYTVGDPENVGVMVMDNDEPLATIGIEFTPSDLAPEGTEVTTMTSGKSPFGPSDTYFVARVPEAEGCQGDGLDRRRFLDKVDQDPETRTGTIADICPVGQRQLEVTLFSGDGSVLASASAGFTITTRELPPPTITLRRYEDETPQETEGGLPLVLEMYRSNRQEESLDGVILELGETGDMLVGNLLTADALGSIFSEHTQQQEIANGAIPEGIAVGKASVIQSTPKTPLLVGGGP